MTHCISTGCTIYVGNYGQYFHGDMYTLGVNRPDIMIFRFNHQIDSYFQLEKWMRHRYTVEWLGFDNFWRPDLGILVIPAEFVKDLSCSPTTDTAS
jgi:hypothetical protein